MSVREKRNGKYRTMLEQGDVYPGSYQVGPTFNGPTSDAGIRIKAIDGKSVQAVSHGYQLFDASKIQSKTMSGVTLTNNGDGSFTIAGSGSIIDHQFSSNKWYCSDISWLKPGTLKLNMGGRVYPQFQVVGYADDENADRTFTLASALDSETRQTVITEEIVERTKHIFMIVWGAQGMAITPGTVKPMLYYDGDGTYEPYTGGKPGPQPEYPIPIESVKITKLTGQEDEETLTTPIVLRSLPDGTKDEYRDGKIIRRVGIAIFDGSSDENWRGDWSKYGLFGIMISNAKKYQYSGRINAVFCNREEIFEEDDNNYECVYLARSYVGGDLCTMLLFGNRQYINNLTDFKTWLQENPLEVLYPLETPTIEPLNLPILPSSAPSRSAQTDSPVDPVITWEALPAGSCALEVQELRKRIEELEKESVESA